jgi:4-diphosphocytidyl-2-C-methyl-D-erythritol kinase
MIAYPNAKVNLGLRILRKRPDGYHDIESVFIPIKWEDIIEVIEDGANGAGRVTFTSSGLEVPADGKPNLCERAYMLLAQEFALPAVKMHLHKMIPMGAGLGGGSADAAFVLRLLHDIFSLGLNDAALEERAARLGSDCPFFIRNRPQYVTGRGELMQPFDLNITGHHILVIHPGVHVGTAEAYAGVTPQVPDSDLRELLQRPISEWRDTVKNDFEGSVSRHHPIIGELKELLYANGAHYASMTGSGAAVFGIFGEKKNVDLPEAMTSKWASL